MRLRPFFSFFGAKWRAARTYPQPVHATIVEPFAGSAGYALHYADRRVVLIEKDARIAALWAYLIAVTADEIRRLPVTFDAVNDMRLAPEARTLIGFWLNRGSEKPRRQPNAWALSGRWPECFWGERVRERIATQVDAIRHWRVIAGSYSDAPSFEAASWFIDPPYQTAGRRYVESSRSLDFAALGAWCRSRPGQVIVCENVGATWLPFRPFRRVRGIGARYSAEAIWVNALDADSCHAVTANLARVLPRPRARLRAPEPRMPAPHVVQVETTLKGARRTFALQEKTLILGPNGSGKTAITQSIEAALTGKASKRGVGLLSREVDLMGLAGPDGFFTEVTLSTGEKASTEIAGSIKQAKRAQRAGPRAVVGALYETIFPATEIIAALDGSPESLRKAILSMVGPRITWAEIAAVMPQPLAAPGAKPPTAQERVKQAQALVTPYAKRPASQLPIDLLIAAREGASLRVKELGTLTKEAEQVASIVSAAADAQGAELRTLEEIDADVVKTEATQKALRAKRTELIDALAAELAKITAPPAKDDVLETAENLALFHAEKDATKCLVCGQSCERGHFAQQVKTLQGAAQGRAKRRSAYQAKCRAVQAAHDEKARAIDAKLTELEGRLRVLAGERGRVEAVAETQAGAAAEAGAKIATLRQQTNTVSELAAQLAQAVKDVLASAADAFAAALTRYYGAPIALELLAGEREVCRLGLKAGDSVFTEVSGSQWARLVGALVAVAMESASESEAPRIVVIPDRQFDAESLAAVLEALAAAPVQVFVQSVLRPAWVPQGWGVIELPRAS